MDCQIDLRRWATPLQNDLPSRTTKTPYHAGPPQRLVSGYTGSFLRELSRRRSKRRAAVNPVYPKLPVRIAPLAQVKLRHKVVKFGARSFSRALRITLPCSLRHQLIRYGPERSALLASSLHHLGQHQRGRVRVSRRLAGEALADAAAPRGDSACPEQPKATDSGLPTCEASIICPVLWALAFVSTPLSPPYAPAAAPLRVRRSSRGLNTKCTRQFTQTELTRQKRSRYRFTERVLLYIREVAAEKGGLVAL